MKAKITFFIGIGVTILSLIQFIFTFAPVRIVGMAVGVFFIIFGWKIGWVKYKKFTVLLGHLALTTGCLVTAYALYQIPFLKAPPGILEVIDLPLFWGLFTMYGGYCMITHSYCSCAINMHVINNPEEVNVSKNSD